MAFALLIIGITLIVAAVRDTQGMLVGLLYNDFTGPKNFFYWVAALLMVGSIGYINKLKPVSNGLLVLIILALFLARGNPKEPGGGFFQKFMEALGGTQTPTGTGTPGTGSIIPPITVSF